MIVETSVSINRVLPNPWQPREGEDPAHVQNLAASIAKDGLLQRPVGRIVDWTGTPISWAGLWTSVDVKEIVQQNQVQIAFGHSRLAAFRYLHNSLDRQPSLVELQTWADMPIIIREISDEEMFRLAVSENLQRRDLNPIEEAKAMSRYRDEFGKTSAEIGALFGMGDSAVRNKIRLLKLPEAVQNLLRTGLISEGAARALIPLFDISLEKRNAAELIYGQVKPSDIIQLASAGTAPAQIAQMVEELANRIDPQPVQADIFSAPVEIPEADAEAEQAEDEAEAVKAMQEAAEQWKQDAGELENVSTETEEEEAEEEEPEPEPAPKPAPVATPERTSLPGGSAPRPPAPPRHGEGGKASPTAQPAAASPSAAFPAILAPELAPVPTPEPAKPMSWADSTITLTITLWPDDGNAEGRMAAVGGRVNQEAPVMRMTRQSAVMSMYLAELLAEMSQKHQ